MAAKCLLVLIFAAFIAQGQSLTEIWLADETTSHLSNPLIPKSISIAKSFLDKLISCHVIYPNGLTYEAFPMNNLIHEEISASDAVEPFNSCSISFRNAPPSLSGTYELLSLVEHSEDGSRTLTRQRFHLEFRFSDSWGTLP